MAQADLNCANATGAAFRADLNNQLLALGTQSSGPTAPSTTYAYQPWVDTTNSLLKIRNSSNSGWQTIGRVDVDNLGLAPPTGNRIINGDMAVDQRNAGDAQTFTAAAALAYSVDRWYGYCTGANVTGQQVQGASAGLFRYRFTGASSVTSIGFGQRIERANSADLVSTTATLSVDLANSLLTTVTWTAYYANTADTFGTLASPTRTQIATGTFTVNSAVTRYSAQISIPAAATNGLEIVFTVGAQTSGTWTIGDVQLESGPVATPFERLKRGHQIMLCQRYFRALNKAIGESRTWSWYADNAGRGVPIWQTFPVTMRVSPTTTSGFLNGINVTGPGTITLTPATFFANIGATAAGGCQVDLVINTFSAEL